MRSRISKGRPRKLARFGDDLVVGVVAGRGFAMVAKDSEKEVSVSCNLIDDT